MSASALLRAVEARLRVVLDDPAGKVCGIQPDGRPPGFAGQVYYAVHLVAVRDRQEATTADQVDADYTIAVTITARLGVAPVDRRGAKISSAGELLDLAEALTEVGVIHGNYSVMNAANAGIPAFGVSANGFEEPLAWVSTSGVQEKAANWIRASGNTPDVYAVEVRFGKARRLRL